VGACDGVLKLIWAADVNAWTPKLTEFPLEEVQVSATSSVKEVQALYVSGRDTMLREFWSNALSPILVTESGMIKAGRLLLNIKAISPMLVTVSGMVMEVSLYMP